MEQSNHKTSILTIFGDLALASFALVLVAATYLGLQQLTPKPNSTLTSRNTAVLGANTASQKLLFLPTRDNPPFLSNSSMTIGAQHEKTSVTLQLLPLEQTTYSITPVTIKNGFPTFKKVTIVPTFSLQNSYTSVSILYDGATQEIISATGKITPIDLEITGNSTSSVTFSISPSVRLATPTTLTIDFTEVP